MKKLALVLLSLCLALAQAVAADVTVTASGVVASGAAKKKTGTAGATITAGQTVYLDTATNTYKLARANVLATSAAAGISLHGASSGQPLVIVTFDPDFIPGATVTEGVHLMVSSATAGGIAPGADLTAGAFPFVFGIVKDGGHWRIDFDSALFTGSALP